MNAFRRRILWLAIRGAIVGMMELRGAVAGVVLQPGTTVEFATVQQGREVLGNRDQYMQRMSQIDRSFLMKTTAAVTEVQYLTFIQNQVLAWSAAKQTKLWFIDNANSRPHPVGLIPANPWGLQDLHGNVSEWCQDWYGAYSAGAVTDPKGPATGTARAIRGGDWRSGSADNCRSAARGSSPPNTRYYGFRFRIVLAPTTS